MDVREALLRAAIKVFAETGSRGATTRRIAQEANVNEVTLFRHFKSKDDLLHDALQFFATQATRHALPEHPVDPRAELLEWCRTHHRELYKVRTLIRRSMGEFGEHPENCSHGMQASVRVANEVTGYLRRLKANGLATGDWDERAAAAMLPSSTVLMKACQDGSQNASGGVAPAARSDEEAVLRRFIVNKSLTHCARLWAYSIADRTL